MGNDNYKGKKPNIPKPLHEAWKKLILPGEASKIAKEVGFSTPVVYAAFKTGYVYRPELVEKINKYFEDNPREPREKSALTDEGMNIIKMAGVKTRKVN